MNKRKVTIGSALMLVFLAVITTANITLYVASDYYSTRLGNIQSNEQTYRKLSEVSDIVSKYFVADYKEEELLDGAIAGYVDALGDRWSGYYTAEEYKLMNDSSNNKYAGVGITVSYDDENMSYKITALADDGPDRTSTR